jgi:hypothetical protein
VSNNERRWSHARKGIIVGTVVAEDETWIHIKLATDHQLRYGSETNRGRVDADGETITARKSLLEEIVESEAINE